MWPNVSQDKHFFSRLELWLHPGGRGDGFTPAHVAQRKPRHAQYAPNVAQRKPRQA